jgi:hypothetical protein
VTTAAAAVIIPMPFASSAAKYKCTIFSNKSFYRCLGNYFGKNSCVPIYKIHPCCWFYCWRND